jgi:hypothetical protein
MFTAAANGEVSDFSKRLGWRSTAARNGERRAISQASAAPLSQLPKLQPVLGRHPASGRVVPVGP